MKYKLKFYLLLYSIIFIGCNSDDDNSQTNNLISEFKIGGGVSYITLNGYFTKYELEGEKENFVLFFIDGKLVPITNPDVLIPCPWVENMSHGITIRFKSNFDDEIDTGTYTYTTVQDKPEINTNSQAFYGFELDNQCYSETQEDLYITDGEMTIPKENEQYTHYV